MSKRKTLTIGELAAAAVSISNLGFDLDDKFFTDLEETASKLSGDWGTGLPHPFPGQLQQPDDPEGCWEWMGSLDKDGYGSIRWKGVTYRSHRLAYKLANPGVRIAKMVLLHSCDNPKCCRPDHLSPGTQAENVADMVAKGRAGWQKETQ